MLTKCTRCGYDINSSETYCLRCGKNVDFSSAGQPVPVIPPVSDPQPPFNPQALKRFCGNCANPINPENNFCSKCGTAVNNHKASLPVNQYPPSFSQPPAFPPYYPPQYQMYPPQYYTAPNSKKNNLTKTNYIFVTSIIALILTLVCFIMMCIEVSEMEDFRLSLSGSGFLIIRDMNNALSSFYALLTALCFTFLAALFLLISSALVRSKEKESFDIRRKYAKIMLAASWLFLLIIIIALVITIIYLISLSKLINYYMIYTVNQDTGSFILIFYLAYLGLSIPSVIKAATYINSLTEEPATSAGAASGTAQEDKERARYTVPERRNENDSDK